MPYFSDMTKTRYKRYDIPFRKLCDITKLDKNLHPATSVMLATRDNHGINPLDCFHLGVHGVLLSGHIHGRDQSQNPSTRLRITSGKLLEKYVEHYGFCRGSYWVSFDLPFAYISIFISIKIVDFN